MEKKLEPKYMIVGIMGLSQMALMSILGLNSNTYTTSTDPRVVRFRRYTNSMPTNPDEMTSFSIVESMVRIVEALLTNLDVSEYELNALVGNDEIPETDAKEISLTCESCNTTGLYEVSVLQTFGSVRCKSCGSKLTGPN